MNDKKNLLTMGILLFGLLFFGYYFGLFATTRYDWYTSTRYLVLDNAYWENKLTMVYSGTSRVETHLSAPFIVTCSRHYVTNPEILETGPNKNPHIWQLIVSRMYGIPEEKIIIGWYDNLDNHGKCHRGICLCCEGNICDGEQYGTDEYGCPLYVKKKCVEWEEYKPHQFRCKKYKEIKCGGCKPDKYGKLTPEDYEKYFKKDGWKMKCEADRYRGKSFGSCYIYNPPMSKIWNIILSSTSCSLFHNGREIYGKVTTYSYGGKHLACRIEKNIYLDIGHSLKAKFYFFEAKKECKDGEEKCVGFIYYVCKNGKWTKVGPTKGKCGVECVQDSDCPAPSIHVEHGRAVPACVNYTCSYKIICDRGYKLVNGKCVPKTCEDYGYSSEKPECGFFGKPETVEVDNLTCYTGKCKPDAPKIILVIISIIIAGWFAWQKLR